MSKFLKAAAGVALAALLIGVPVTPVPRADAEAPAYRASVEAIGGGTYVNVRSAPSTSAPILRRIAPGTALQVQCQTVGSRLGGDRYADNRTWDKTSLGFVHDVLVTTTGGARIFLPDGGYAAFSTQAGIPQCGSQQSVTSSRAERAVAFALGQVGVSQTSLTPDGMWAGWCELLVERSWGTSGKYPSAIANYRSQLAQGRIHSGVPPRGVVVFYSWGALGHAGVSLGNGQVVSTQGTYTPMPVRQHAYDGIGLQYLGWAQAPDSWPGR